MRVCIIGGGLTGLSAAYALSKENEVVVYERGAELGGAAASYEKNGFRIERFYHHFFAGDRELEALLRELGLWEQVEFRSASIGQMVGGRVYKMNTMLEIARSFLSPLEIFRLGLLTMKARFFEDASKLDGVGAVEWAKANGGESVFKNFFAPLLRGKFDENMDRVSAAWLVSRIKIRSNRSPTGEKLAYLRGGFWKLVSALEEKIVERGGMVVKGEAVEEVIVKGGVAAGVRVGGNEQAFDSVIVTSPGLMKKEWAPAGLRERFGSLDYQCAVCVLMGLKEKLLDDVYWLNLSDPAPFGAVVEHTNYMPLGDYGGTHLVYLASYAQSKEAASMRDSKKEVVERYLEGLKKLFPGFGKENVEWAEVFRDEYSGPVYSKGFFKKVPGYKTSV